MLRRLRWKTLTFIIVIVGLAFASLVPQTVDLDVPGIRLERGTDDILGLSLGLDLAGGTQLVYQAGDASFAPSEEQMEGLVASISRRVDRLGVSEPSIQTLGSDRLLIQLPGVEDVESAKALIGATAQLEIVERVCENRSCAIPGIDFEDLPTGLTGADVGRAFAGQDSVTSEPTLYFELKTSAARRFAEVTQRINRTNLTDSPDQLAYVLDGADLVSATVSTPILTGSGQISGAMGFEEVRRLAIQIEGGRLPVPIKEISSTVVAASLGSRSLEDALIAGMVGLALVLAFMTAYYRASGFVAALSLVCYTAIVLAIFKMLPVTLTLAGLAAFVLSLGMAVDANILIFERMKEELRIGRSLQFASQIGFSRAWQSIRDGNISTLIIAGILFLFGSGSANSAVTGFSVTLAIGVLTSMFTAIVISRNLLAILVGTGLRRFPRLFSPDQVSANPLGSERGA